MNWLNIFTPTLRAPAFIGSDPVARATWLYVLAYCAEQENGGRIVGARTWKDRQWQQTCGVTVLEVDSSGPLLTWEGNDLLIFAYPKEKEEEIRRKRAGGKRGGKASAKARLEASSEAQHGISGSSSASSSASTEGEGERERKEKGKEPPSPPKALPSGFDDFWQAYPKRVGKGHAERAWAKLRCGPLLPQILTAVRKAKVCPDWTKDGGQFIPHPATWLNRRGWEDELTPVNGSRGVPGTAGNPYL